MDEITFGKHKMHRSLEEAVEQRRATRNLNNDVRVQTSSDHKLLKLLGRSAKANATTGVSQNGD